MNIDNENNGKERAGRKEVIIHFFDNLEQLNDAVMIHANRQKKMAHRVKELTPEEEEMNEAMIVQTSTQKEMIRRLKQLVLEELRRLEILREVFTPNK
jgi:hypothetical protein